MAEYTSDERAILWLCACTRTEYRERVSLLRAAPSPSALFEDPVPYFEQCVAPERRTVSRTPAEREREIAAFVGELELKGYFAVTLLSEDYPRSLGMISLPPLVLYGAGRRELLAKRRFCIVGSRVIPPWAEKLGRSISEALSHRFAIVTGLAEGGDSAAIEGAMSEGNLISVLPCGLDECYPAAHAALKERIRKKGLLLSELLPSETAKKYSFHARNRLLAGLSEGVLVLSAGKRSGTLITANCALEYGRDVFALPHNVGSAQGEGCNDLLKKGAYVVTCAGDVFDAFGMETVAKQGPDLTPDEARVLEVLRSEGELHAAVIAERTGLKIFEVTALLSALEIKGAAVKSGGNRYQAV